jgi:hypothetical protein
MVMLYGTFHNKPMFFNGSKGSWLVPLHHSGITDNVCEKYGGKLAVL